MKRIGFAALFIASVSFSFGAELISNGDMESFTGTTPTGWSTTQLDGSGNVIGTAHGTNSQETSDVHGGSSAFKHVSTASQFTYRYFLHTPAIGTSDGDPVFSVWTKTTATAGFRYYRSQSTNAGATWTIDFSPEVALPLSTTWTQTTTSNWNGEFNDVGKLHRVSFHRINAGTFIIDDASLQGTAPVTMSGFELE